MVAEANTVQDDYRFVVTSLPEYLRDQPTAGLATWSGELRSGARANVLIGVASNRVDVHQVCAAAERAIERRAEPLSALLLPPDRYPDKLLDVAWREFRPEIPRTTPRPRVAPTRSSTPSSSSSRKPPNGGESVGERLRTRWRP